MKYTGVENNNRDNHCVINQATVAIESNTIIVNNTSIRNGTFYPFYDLQAWISPHLLIHRNKFY